MKALEPLIFVAGGIAIALLSTAITALYYRARITRLHRESWKQAEVFYTRREAEQRRI